jgi:hypothetical protein
MTTVLYGDIPESDVEPGNRVDVESASSPSVPAPPPMRPTYPTPTPTPWVRREPVAEPPPSRLGAVLGVAAASLVAACIAYIAATRRATV